MCISQDLLCDYFEQQRIRVEYSNNMNDTKIIND